MYCLFVYKNIIAKHEITPRLYALSVTKIIMVPTTSFYFKKHFMYLIIDYQLFFKMYCKKKK